ncbi:PREDICTED: uncharacterized protein LOC109483310 [Branchiostoma belcheri]|uniref:Uncharacterized protein LOC109483310 n=1 Tax=Branchiostoma belcheri TaxID=7741 RepID=A0A6P5AIT1_BRABE|nr:PREDICTED: uncharacterized protein LOC109483310 [Branchiostoma belcheri]
MQLSGDALRKMTDLLLIVFATTIRRLLSQVVELARFMYNTCWLICEALYTLVIFVCEIALPIISLCKDVYRWLRTSVTELFKTILSLSQLLWSISSLVLREWWTYILNSRAWAGIVNIAYHFKLAAINAFAVIHYLSITAKKAASVGFHTVKQLSAAVLRKITELLLTSKIAFTTIMHYIYMVMEHMIVPSVMYAKAIVKELAQGTVQYLQVYGSRVREAMVDAMWSAYNYDYNGVLYMLLETLRGTMRRVLYRDANVGKT